MNNLIQQFIGAWVRPWDTMRLVKEQPEDTSIKPSMIFIVVMGLLSGIFTALMSFPFPPAQIASGAVPKSTVWLSIPLLPLFYLIGSFLSAAFVWGVVSGFLRGTANQYKTTYRLMSVPVAFYPISTLIAPIPKVGQWLAIAINIWATVVLIRGIIIVMDTPTLRTWLTFVLIFLGIVLLAFFASMAARQQMTTGSFPSAADFSNEDLNFDNKDESSAQLDDLVGKETPAKQPEQPKK